jgi:hypothetical protein
MSDIGMKLVLYIYIKKKKVIDHFEFFVV